VRSEAARFWLVAGAVLAALGVAAGAFGAHALRARLGPSDLVTFETAVRYQMYHALGLLLTGLLADRGVAVAPVLLFSCSPVLLLSCLSCSPASPVLLPLLFSCCPVLLGSDGLHRIDPGGPPGREPDRGRRRAA
jgi:hypothetical protein